MISRTSLHALRALAQLASIEPGRFAGAAALAREIHAPGNYLGKLLQSLAREGLVESRKGLGGGFRLARPASRIRLYDVIDHIDQLEGWSQCFVGQPLCTDEAPCLLHERWKQLRDDYLNFLKDTTIADMTK